MLRLTMGGPWYRATHPKLTVSLARFCVESPQHGCRVEFLEYADGMLDISRNLLMQKAIDHGSEWLVSVDADVSFDGRAPEICKMLKEFYRQDVAVIGAPLELPDGAANVVDLKDDLLPWIWLGKSKPPMQVNKIGFGFVAFRLGWYAQRWPKDEAYFQGRVARIGSSFLAFSEDYNHCQRVRELGGQVWCDPRIGAIHEMGRTVR